MPILKIFFYPNRVTRMNSLHERLWHFFDMNLKRHTLPTHPSPSRTQMTAQGDLVRRNIDKDSECFDFIHEHIMNRPQENVVGLSI